MAAQEPASLSLGELVRRASCPGVSTGAQAMKELGEERPGWLAGPLPPKASESPAARTLVFAGLWPAEPKQLGQGQAGNPLQGCATGQLFGQSGSCVASSCAQGPSLEGGAASGEVGGPRPQQVSSWAAHTAPPPADSREGLAVLLWAHRWRRPPSSPGSWACLASGGRWSGERGGSDQAPWQVLK